MNTPVDKNSAAGLLLCCKRTAETGNATAIAERAVNVIDVTELAVKVHLAKLFNGLVETVANTDVEDLALLLSLFCHFARKLVVDSNGLLTENVLACAESVHRDGVVSIVGGKYPNSLYLGVG